MYVFAEVEGVRWMRQYRRNEQGREWLLALDPRFPEIELTGLDWKVLGIIIQRNLRRKIKHYDYRDAGASSNVPTSQGAAVDITRQGA